MLRGEAQYALDNKGRVVIPPKFRAVLGDQIVLTRWFDECLAAFSPAEWRSVEEKFRGQPLRVLDQARLVLSGATDCDLDRQGRVAIPRHLRHYAKITRSVTIIGVGVHLELWSAPIWQRKLRQVPKTPEALPEQLQGLIL